VNSSENKVVTLSSQDLVRIRFYGWDSEHYSPETYAMLRTEKQFKPEAPLPLLSREEGRAVALGERPCPVCRWDRNPNTIVSRETPQLHRGVETGVEVNLLVACSCRLFELLYDRWSGRRAMVQERYQQVRLSTLKPDAKVMLEMPHQRHLIAHLREHPNDSYLFCGETGTGKTTYQTALFGHALANWARWAYTRGGFTEGVWRIGTSTLLKQHMDWNRRLETVNRNDDGGEAMAGPALPLVRREDILAARKSGFRPSLFLDEIDKTTLTTPQKTVLFDIIDAIYECNGQLVVCANSGMQDLETILGKRMGAATIRRITSATESGIGIPTAGHVFDFFNPRWTDNLSKPQATKSTPKAPRLTEEKPTEASATFDVSDQTPHEASFLDAPVAQTPTTRLNPSRNSPKARFNLLPSVKATSTS
jgi:hypothetical protein